MTLWQILIGVALFAIATAIVYAWGLGKAIDQKSALQRNLMSACGSKVVKHLKKHGHITEKEVAGLIEGMTVGQFWSRNKLKVQNGEKVAPQVIEFLLEQQYIESDGQDTYRLKQ